MTELAQAAAGPAELDRRRVTGVVVAVSLALFCVNTDFFALNLALPTMAKGFDVGARSIQWTISAYMLSVGALFILAGRIGDIFLFIAASFVAQNLIVARRTIWASREQPGRIVLPDSRSAES